MWICHSQFMPIGRRNLVMKRSSLALLALTAIPNSRIVGKPYLTGLCKVCPSFAQNWVGRYWIAAPGSISLALWLRLGSARGH